MLTLEISNLSKSFGDKKILDDLSISINNGEIFGLIGLNGVGKTTLIKIILDLLDADFGEIKIMGELSSEPNTRKHLRYLPEKFQISSTLKGIEFLKIFEDFDGRVDKEKLDEEINTLADVLGLDKKSLRLRASKYSKGMMQKIGLISTFLGNSDLAILDEPMSGLDPKARIQLKNLFLDNKNKGKSIFFSSHILSDIDEICDRVGVLNQGKLIFVGTPLELKKRYEEISLEKAFIELIK